MIGKLVLMACLGWGGGGYSISGPVLAKHDLPARQVWVGGPWDGHWDWYAPMKVREVEDCGDWELEGDEIVWAVVVSDEAFYRHEVGQWAYFWRDGED